MLLFRNSFYTAGSAWVGSSASLAACPVRSGAADQLDSPPWRPLGLRLLGEASSPPASPSTGVGGGEMEMGLCLPTPCAPLHVPRCVAKQSAHWYRWVAAATLAPSVASFQWGPGRRGPRGLP